MKSRAAWKPGYSEPEWWDTNAWQADQVSKSTSSTGIPASINTLQRVRVSLIPVGVLVAFGRGTFYLPDNPVLISFQTTGVLLMGGVLGLRWGLFAILVYYFLGMAGVPVFNDGGNDWQYVSGQSPPAILWGSSPRSPWSSSCRSGVGIAAEACGPCC